MLILEKLIGAMYPRENQLHCRFSFGDEESHDVLIQFEDEETGKKYIVLKLSPFILKTLENEKVFVCRILINST